ncbi:MAG: hypothetical protein QXN16_04335 [Candidatus Micrarchaeaceae archaeon]
MNEEDIQDENLRDKLRTLGAFNSEFQHHYKSPFYPDPLGNLDSKQLIKIGVWNEPPVVGFVLEASASLVKVRSESGEMYFIKTSGIRSIKLINREDNKKKR